MNAAAIVVLLALFGQESIPLAEYRDRLRAIGSAVFDRFSATPAQTLWYYRSLADTFSRQVPGPLAAEFERTVTLIEELAKSE
jgi:hypothetical protein